jgi:hypothetical protein
LLRIRTYQTDSITKNFLKKNIPFLAEKPSKTGGWTAYPPIEDTIITYTVGHSIVFPKHPFIDLGITHCKLDFLTTEKNNKLNTFQTYFMTFFFDSKQNAIKTFKMLCSEYDKLSKSKKITTKTDRQIAIYRNVDDRGLFPSVQFILTKDDLYHNKYKIIFGDILDLNFEYYYGSQQ